jgi:hypothetical protein
MTKAAPVPETKDTKARIGESEAPRICPVDESEPIRCLTFRGVDGLPQHIRDKMAADRAVAEQRILIRKED